MTCLITGGIVRSTRGAKGGFSLAKPTKEIKLSEVIQLLEGSIALVECVNNPRVCARSELCVTRDVWGELKEAMNGVLESIPYRIWLSVKNKKNSLKSRCTTYDQAVARTGCSEGDSH